MAQPMVRCQRGGGAPGVAMAVVVAGGRSGGAEPRVRWGHCPGSRRLLGRGPWWAASVVVCDGNGVTCERRWGVGWVSTGAPLGGGGACGTASPPPPFPTYPESTERPRARRTRRARARAASACPKSKCRLTPTTPSDRDMGRVGARVDQMVQTQGLPGLLSTPKEPRTRRPASEPAGCAQLHGGGGSTRCPSKGAHRRVGDQSGSGSFT